MFAKLAPLAFLILGVAAGIGAGIFLGPQPESESHDDNTPEKHQTKSEASTATEFVKLNNQFVIPVVQDGRVVSLVVMSLSIETRVPMRELVFEREPKLRDSFLRVLFDHANMGGFNGSFTQADTLQILRNSLKDVATAELGENVETVLITDIARQDS